MPFGLPYGTRQGRPLWYLVRLQAEARFARGVRGKFVLAVDVNGATAAQIPIVVRRRALRLEELGLVEGRRARAVAGRRARIDFRNYVQISGIRGGENVLRFAIEPVAVTGADRRAGFGVDVLGASGIEATSALPDELLLHARPAELTARVGEHVDVRYLLERRGGRPDGPVDVRFTPGGLELRGADVAHHPRVGGGAQGRFTALGKAPGRYLAMLAVADRFNEPSTPVTITVVAAPAAAGGRGAGPVDTVAGGLLALTGLALVLRSRRRRRGLATPG